MANYWQERRAEALTRLSNKSRKQIDTQLRKYYKNTAKNVMREFENTYNKLLEAMEDGKKPTPADLYKLDKYWQLQAQLRAELQKLGEREVVALTKEFSLNFFDVYYSYAKEGETAFNTLDIEGVNQMVNSVWCADGKSWSARVWENTEKLAETLNEELIHIVASGKGAKDLKQLLQERFNVSYSQADMLVRTELAHIQTEAAKKRYEDYGIQYVQIWADKDERQCEVCGKLHKKVYPVGAAVPIPAHPRCRCCIIPIVE